MDADAKLTSVDIASDVQEIAHATLGDDPRLTFCLIDGATFLRAAPESHYDFIFADFRPGKFSDRNLAFRSLRKGGFYFLDDLLPQTTWPEGHQDRVDILLNELKEENGITPLFLNWGSGLFVATRR